MPDVSDEELNELREDNKSLRERIASAQIKQAENDSARQREYEALQLVAENTRLEAQLNAAEAAADSKASEQGASGVLAAAKEQLEAAVAQGKQTPGPVDTNTTDQPKNTTGATTATEEKVTSSSTSQSNASTTLTNGGN